MVTIRPAEPSDLPEAARVWRAGWLDAHVGQVPDALLAERTEAYFTRTVDEMADSTLVAVDDDGTLRGVVMVHEAELFQLAVSGGARGRGVGQALVGAAEELIAVGHDFAELAVVPGNLTARRLYERCGWVDQGEIAHPARPGDPGDEPIPVVVHHYVKRFHS